jgi:hypothetical protein
LLDSRKQLATLPSCTYHKDCPVSAILKLICAVRWRTQQCNSVTLKCRLKQSRLALDWEQTISGKLALLPNCRSEVCGINRMLPICRTSTALASPTITHRSMYRHPPHLIVENNFHFHCSFCDVK